MKHCVRWALVALVALVMTAPAWAQEAKSFDFADGKVPEGWTVQGDVTIDKDKSQQDSGTSLRVGPGGKATYTFQEAPASGKVEIVVYEDGVSVAKPKGGHDFGALYGIGQGPGKPALVTGAIYASYLAGDTSYSLGDFTPGKAGELPSHKVSFLGLKRTEGWHKWTFTMDAEKGLTVAHNGRNLPANRFDWNKSRIEGMNQVIILGDKADGKQVVWVDTVNVTPGEPMKAKPTPPPPPPPAVPEADPEVSAADVVKLQDKVAGKHPRLLFTAEDIPALKAKAAGPGAMFWERVNAYLPACKPPEEPKFQRDATDGQRQGMWRMPTVAVHYAMTGDKQSYEKGLGYMQMLLKLENWETGGETDSGMSSANISIGAALLYDALYNDLPEDFRNKFRDKLLTMARRQYHRGHLKKAGGTHYWQNDPQNNHRWHRDAGMVLSLLAVAGECGGKENWMLGEMVKEIAYISKWLPEDGTTHEGPTYMPFGAPYLALVHDASDRNLGTNYLQMGFWKHAPLYRMHTLAPGLTSAIPYGDCGGGTGAINDYTLLATGRNNQADLQDAIMEYYKANVQRNEDGSVRHHMTFMYGWLGMLWYNPDVPQGSIDNLSKNFYFDDVGLVYARDGWKQDNVAVMFKCSPYGGYLLNHYRNTHNNSYINVAHDDPDANTFVLYADGGRVIDSDGYSLIKNTQSHNTILVNGKGQKGSNNGVWSQPLKGKDADMSKLAFITTYKDGGEVVLSEGEASNSYVGLDRYRRAVIWVSGKYLLVLDDIRGAKSPEITWLNQSREVEAVDAGKGIYRFTNKARGRDGDSSILMQVVANRQMEIVVGDSAAAAKKELMGYKQLQVTMPGDNLRVAAVYDAWNKGNVSVAMAAAEGETYKVTVKGPGFEDVWTWTAASEKEKPASFSSAGSTTFEAGAADWAVIPYPGMGRPQEK